jgi:ribosomal protein L11 methyltransferase
MTWSEVSISVARKHVPLAEFALQQLGALAITFEDDADHPVLEPGPGATPLWPAVHVRGLLKSGVDRPLVVSVLQIVPGADRPGHIRWHDIEDQDWERAWMDRFEPMKFGQRLWVVPGGMHIPHDPENIEISLDPGLAFGTGTHPTTALCLEWIDAHDLSSTSVVDYGCGSGILAIAAILKGARSAIGVDNDPQALEATAANASRNGISDRISGQLPGEFSTSGADIVLANILAKPLLELAPVFTSCTRAGGWIVLSGLLEEQVGEVIAAYESDCEEDSVGILDGWARVVMRRRG